MIDWGDILTKSVIALVPACATWLFSNVLKMRADLNAAFRKIRQLEQHCKLSDTDHPEGERDGRR